MVEHVIALAADTPLYAPLYIAQEARFFGSMPVAMGTLDLPISKPASSARSSRDWSRLSQQVSAIFKPFDVRNPCLLTVCDPMHAILYNANPGAQDVHLTGALLVKPACWVFNCSRDLPRVLASLRNGTRLRTHPPGMTADTLARLLLKEQGFTPSEMNDIIQHVEPGEELTSFMDSSGDGVFAALSPDLATMRQIESEQGTRFGIAHDFSDTRPYLMTGLLATRTSLEKHPDALRRISVGIELALRMLKEDTSAALALLQQHYLRRATQSPSDAIS